jgi:ABC-type methionine transport system ATPase subunit
MRARAGQQPLSDHGGQSLGEYRSVMSYEIVELLSEINHCGTTVLMVTHEHGLVSKFNHRTIVISEGSVVADGRMGANVVNSFFYLIKEGIRNISSKPYDFTGGHSEY